MTNEEGLSVRWNKREHDLMIHYPRKCDGALVSSFLESKIPTIDDSNPLNIKYEKLFLKELEDRGYDITTFKMSIKLKLPKE